MQEQFTTDIAKLDERLSTQPLSRSDIAWHSVFDAPLSIHGVLYDKDLEQFIRMPVAAAREVSPAVGSLSRMTSGGRVRFRTNSSFVAISCLAPYYVPMPHMPLSGSHGFAVYTDGVYSGKVTPSFEAATTPVDRSIAFRGLVNTRPPKDSQSGMRDIEIYFPLYGGVKQLFIGLEENAVTEAPRAYTYAEPIVFYGSSITQGACASRPGNDMAARLSRLLDADYINLGFSGNGNAEPAMLEYLTKLPASAYIFDYNYYLDLPDRILPPHLSIYETLRAACPTSVIMMVDKPCTVFSPKNYEARTRMIRSTYEEAVRRGDDLVGWLDAVDFFGSNVEHDSCVVDSDHPNDLGFWHMAESLHTPMRNLLERRAKR